MKRLLLLVNVIILLFSSCSNNDGQSSTSSSVLLKKAINSSFSSSFEYDGNKLSKIIVSNGQKYVYSYTEDLITKVSIYVYDMSSADYEIFYDYDSNNKLITERELEYENMTTVKTIYTYNSDGTITYNEYSGNFINQVNPTTRMGKMYLNTNGEVIKKEDYYQGSLINKTEYTFDAKNSPLKNITGYNKLFLLFDNGKINNILTNTSYNIDNILTYGYSNQYAYNANGFPTLITTTLDNGSTSTSQYFY